jgi:hypothetical protein
MVYGANKVVPGQDEVLLCRGYNVQKGIFHIAGEKSLTNCELFRQIMLTGIRRQTEKQRITTVLLK